jgi:hypothetical protein
VFVSIWVNASKAILKQSIGSVLLVKASAICRRLKPAPGRRQCLLALERRVAVEHVNGRCLAGRGRSGSGPTCEWHWQRQERPLNPECREATRRNVGPRTFSPTGASDVLPATSADGADWIVTGGNMSLSICIKVATDGPGAVRPPEAV